MKKLAAILAAATLGSISISAVAAENFQRLSGNQIRAKFRGMQLTDEVHSRDGASKPTLLHDALLMITLFKY